jgi:hypothetical protein
MSITLNVLRGRVRERVRDTDVRSPSRDIAEYDTAIADAYIALSAWLPAPTSVTASAGTIAANADTFTLPTASSEEYAGEVRIRLRSDGTFLTRRTVEEIDRLRSGDISTVGTSRPTDFCMWEELDQDVQCRCWPRSKDAESYDLHRTLAPDELRDLGFDLSTVQFSRFGTVALVLHASALMVEGMTDDDLATRKLNRGVAGDWMRDSRVVLYKERERRHNLESVGRTLRMVS